MGNRNIVGVALHFIIYTAIQLLFFRNVALFQNTFCYLYIATIILLPFETGRIAQLFIGFAIGMFVDFFYDTLGMHAFASVFLAYARMVTLNYLQPSTGYESGGKPLVREMGITWFATYAIILVFLHHMVFFAIESSDFSLLLGTLVQSIGSTIFTFTVIMIGQLVFYQKKAKA